MIFASLVAADSIGYLAYLIDGRICSVKVLKMI